MNKDDDVYSNIRRSYLHNVVSKIIFLPCVEMVKWIIDHVNLENKTIVHEQGKCMSSSITKTLEMCYKFCNGKSVYASISGGRVWQREELPQSNE